MVSTTGSSITISGTPTLGGSFSFTLRADDPFGNFPGSKAYTIGVVQIITPSPLPSGMVLVNYSQTLTSMYGTGPYTFNLALVTGETFPPGLSLSQTGTLSGVPTNNSAGTYNFTVQTTDAAGVRGIATFELTILLPLAISTGSPLPPGTIGVSYSQTFNSTGGQSPYAYSIATGTVPGGLSLNISGVLSGTPTAVGTFNFTVKVADSQQFSATKQFQVTISTASPLLQVSPLQLSFAALEGGDAPPPQVIKVVPSGRTAASFAITLDSGTPGSNTPGWLTVKPTSGNAPSGLIVSANQTGLPATSFTGRIHITVPQNQTQTPIDVLVNFTISSGPAKLRVVPDSLRFAARVQAPGTLEQVLAVGNAGGGGTLNFTASVLQHSGWISSVTPAAAQASPNSPVLVRVSVNTQGLGIGSYHDVIRISSSAGSVDVPVSLFVSDRGPILGLTVTGLRFLARQGSATSLAKTVRVLNLGDSGTTINWSANLMSGSEWLTLPTSNGAATPTNPGNLPLSPSGNVANFPAGGRYALVRVSDPQALNSPQYLVAVLDIRAGTSPAEPDLSPQGLYFTTAGGTPAAQTVNVSVSSTAPVAFQAASSTTDGANWLTVNVTSSTASTQTPGTISVSVSSAGLTPGIYTGGVHVALDGVLRTVNVTFIVAPTLAGSVRQGSGLQAEATAGCTPSRLALTQTGLVNNFAVPAGWPATLIVQLNDDCGNAVSNGAAVASFSNGDPPLSLAGDHQTSTYSATWQPGIVTSSMTVTVRATAPLLQQATAQWTGTIDQNSASPPTLVPNGILHIFFNGANAALLGGGLAPGNVTQVYGTGLASLTSSTTVPLPTEFSGTFMLIGSQQAPLFYVANNTAAQFGLNIQVPFELTPNRQYATIVSANGALTLPQTIDVVPLQPGMAAFPDGGIIAQHLDYSLVSASNPAKRGEILIIYLAGLGPTEPSVKSGDPTPLDYFLVKNKVAVTVDGQNTDVGFAGLTPTGVGLYQIVFTVPPNAKAGTLDVVVTQGGITSNTTKLLVAP